MKKLFSIAIVSVSLLSGCSIERKSPICEASYRIGGSDYSASIYAVKKENGHTMLKAGHPFNFRYVSVSNFTSNTCI